MLLNPACLPRVWRQQGQAHHPNFTSLLKISFGLKRLRLGSELVEFLGVNKRVTLIAHHSIGRELVRAALAVANQFRTKGGHGLNGVLFISSKILRGFYSLRDQCVKTKITCFG